MSAHPIYADTGVAFHPFVDVFPMLPKADLDRLAADIAENGLAQPIITFEGAVLDGRNRLLACGQARVAPRYEPFRGTRDEALRFVVSLNLRRRHLDESQRAMVATKLSNLGHGQRKAAGQICLSQPEAAELLNVSPRSVKSAARVVSSGVPELQAAVSSGRVAVSAAAEIATAPKKEQREIVAMGEKEILRAAKEIKRERAVVREATKDEKNRAAAWRPDETKRRKEAEKGGIVVANLKTDGALVAWAKEEGRLVVIDRTTDWGNPFHLGADGDRPYVIASYAIYLTRKPSLLKQLAGLKGKVLGCWCYPEACHGEELARAAH